MRVALNILGIILVFFGLIWLEVNVSGKPAFLALELIHGHE